MAAVQAGDGAHARRGRLHNRCVRVDDRAWDLFLATAFARGEAASEALRRMIDDYNEQDGAWDV